MEDPSFRGADVLLQSCGNRTYLHCSTSNSQNLRDFQCVVFSGRGHLFVFVAVGNLRQPQPSKIEDFSVLCVEAWLRGEGRHQTFNSYTSRRMEDASKAFLSFQHSPPISYQELPWFHLCIFNLMIKFEVLLGTAEKASAPKSAFIITPRGAAVGVQSSE
jgi:hypothetical protein